jgi:hypothetical protein
MASMIPPARNTRPVSIAARRVGAGTGAGTVIVVRTAPGVVVTGVIADPTGVTEFTGT